MREQYDHNGHEDNADAHPKAASLAGSRRRRNGRQVPPRRILHAGAPLFADWFSIGIILCMQQPLPHRRLTDEEGGIIALFPKTPFVLFLRLLKEATASRKPRRGIDSLERRVYNTLRVTLRSIGRHRGAKSSVSTVASARLPLSRNMADGAREAAPGLGVARKADWQIVQGGYGGISSVG